MNELEVLERRIAARRRDLRRHTDAAREEAVRILNLPRRVRRRPLTSVAVGALVGFGSGVALRCGPRAREGRPPRRWTRSALRTVARVARSFLVSAVLSEVPETGGTPS